MSIPVAPVRRIEGYLPIEDHGLIGDGTTAALVGRDGAVSWLCLPRFDAPPIFCALLDAARGGAFRLAPEPLLASGQAYLGESGALMTEMHGPEGRVRVTDCLPLRADADLREDATAGRGELLRLVEGLAGTVRLRVEVEPRGGARAEARGGGLALTCPARPDLALHLSASVPLPGPATTLTVRAGERLHFLLRWDGRDARTGTRTPAELLQDTVSCWERWMKHVEYDGPRPGLVRRSLITLKLLDYFPNGAIVAAPTSSLPEVLGGTRNWDYRYAWIRDAAFSVYAFHRIGLTAEARTYLAWALDAAEGEARPRVLYDLDGRVPPSEREDSTLQGYRRSRPVRWGNAAADQRQHDVYGEILDCAYQWAARHGGIDEALWARLRALAEAAGREWRHPDHGLWEVRTPGRPFTYSAALCQVALDRAARLAERFGLAGDVRGWRAAAETIRQAIFEEAWDPRQQALTEHLGGGGLDAGLLALPLRRVIPADHPRMVATTEAIRARLGAGGGLLFRYRLEDSPDGLPGREGAFVLVSFWLVDNLTMQGRLDEAHALFESLCGRASPLGLLPEQIDPGSGAFLGNFPQAFSHVGLISSGVNLARAGAP